MNAIQQKQKIIMCISKTDYCFHCRATTWFTKIFGAWFCGSCHLRDTVKV